MLPAATIAVTWPVVLPTVSIAVLALVHIPPGVASERSMPGPLRDTVDGPVIAFTVGVIFTDTTAVALQPLPAIYEIVAVPGFIPVTPPDPDIVATLGVLLVHDTPGVVASLTCVTMPVHTVRIPLIGAGVAFTVRISIRVQPVLVEVKVIPVVPAARPITSPDPSILA